MPRLRSILIKRKLKKSHALVETLESIAHEHKVTTAQVVLNWTINFHGNTIVAIPGSTKTIQAEQNARAIDLKLSSEEMETIHELSLNI
jgi:diketogulonate reductase-like aldo/keto reductase